MDWAELPSYKWWGLARLVWKTTCHLTLKSQGIIKDHVKVCRTAPTCWITENRQLSSSELTLFNAREARIHVWCQMFASPQKCLLPYFLIEMSYSNECRLSCCHKFASSAVLLQRFMQIISLQFSEGPNPVLVSQKSDCAGCTEEGHCFGVPPEAGFPQNVDTKSQIGLWLLLLPS